MKRVSTLGAVALGFAVLAAPPAAGQAPPGQGLVARTVTCLEGGTFAVVETRGGGANVYVNGQHVLLQSISVVVPGEPTFTKTFGVKAGLPTTITCTFVEGGATFTVTVAALPADD